MKFFLRFYCHLFLAAFMAVGAVAHADTYQFFDLGSADRVSIFGITASGIAVLLYNSPVGAPECAISHICQEYETWENGVMVDYSPIAPNLVYDNGTPCTVSPSFLAFSVPGTCNNGYEVYNAGPAAPAPYTDEIFTGPDPAADFFANSVPFIEDIDLNSSGDFIYNASHPAGGSGENFEAIDLTTLVTPEPASFLMLSTGFLCFAGIIRRRRSVCPKAANEAR